MSVIVRAIDDGVKEATKVLTDEPFKNLKGEFCRAYERWVLALRTFEHDFKNKHIIDQAWEEYISWREMWLRSH